MGRGEGLLVVGEVQKEHCEMSSVCGNVQVVGCIVDKFD
jgi:hypothetical protein